MDDMLREKRLEEWQAKQEKDPERFITCGGRRYYIGREDVPEGSKGFGGEARHIKFLGSGKIVRSTNLSYNGSVPESWKDRLPDTAEFISKTEYERIARQEALG